MPEITLQDAWQLLDLAEVVAGVRAVSVRPKTLLAYYAAVAI